MAKTLDMSKLGIDELNEFTDDLNERTDSLMAKEMEFVNSNIRMVNEWLSQFKVLKGLLPDSSYCLKIHDGEHFVTHGPYDSEIHNKKVPSYPDFKFRPVGGSIGEYVLNLNCKFDDMVGVKTFTYGVDYSSGHRFPSKFDDMLFKEFKAAFSFIAEKGDMVVDTVTKWAQERSRELMEERQNEFNKREASLNEFNKLKAAVNEFKHIDLQKIGGNNPEKIIDSITGMEFSYLLSGVDTENFVTYSAPLAEGAELFGKPDVRVELSFRYAGDDVESELLTHAYKIKVVSYDKETDDYIELEPDYNIAKRLMEKCEGFVVDQYYNEFVREEPHTLRNLIESIDMDFTYLNDGVDSDGRPFIVYNTAFNTDDAEKLFGKGMADAAHIELSFRYADDNPKGEILPHAYLMEAVDYETDTAISIDERLAGLLKQKGEGLAVEQCIKPFNEKLRSGREAETAVLPDINISPYRKIAEGIVGSDYYEKRMPEVIKGFSDMETGFIGTTVLDMYYHREILVQYISSTYNFHGVEHGIDEKLKDVPVSDLNLSGDVTDVVSPDKPLMEAWAEYRDYAIVEPVVNDILWNGFPPSNIQERIDDVMRSDEFYRHLVSERIAGDDMGLFDFEAMDKSANCYDHINSMPGVDLKSFSFYVDEGYFDRDGVESEGKARFAIARVLRDEVLDWHGLFDAVDTHYDTVNEILQDTTLMLAKEVIADAERGRNSDSVYTSVSDLQGRADELLLKNGSYENFVSQGLVPDGLGIGAERMFTNRPFMMNTVIAVDDFPGFSPEMSRYIKKNVDSERENLRDYLRYAVKSDSPKAFNALARCVRDGIMDNDDKGFDPDAARQEIFNPALELLLKSPARDLGDYNLSVLPAGYVRDNIELTGELADCVVKSFAAKRLFLSPMPDRDLSDTDDFIHFFDNKFFRGSNEDLSLIHNILEYGEYGVYSANDKLYVYYDVSDFDGEGKPIETMSDLFSLCLNIAYDTEAFEVGEIGNIERLLWEQRLMSPIKEKDFDPHLSECCFVDGKKFDVLYRQRQDSEGNTVNLCDFYDFDSGKCFEIPVSDSQLVEAMGKSGVQNTFLKHAEENFFQHYAEECKSAFARHKVDGKDMDSLLASAGAVLVSLDDFYKSKVSSFLQKQDIKNPAALHRFYRSKLCLDGGHDVRRSTEEPDIGR